GNPVLLVGAATGRDGIHGATFASAELDEQSEERRPAVQVGNPFLEKLLLEACLELLASGDVVAMQDLGAAGLTSSSAELAARGGCGIDLDVARVSRRETGMTPYEVMLSESQERMLVVLPRGQEARRSSPNLASRAAIFRQYDHTVQANTVVPPGRADAAVLRVRGSRQGLALTADSAARYAALDPRRGAALAVAEAARNLSCCGAVPLAATDCLNLGNPERPEVADALWETVEGLREACLTLEIPI